MTLTKNYFLQPQLGLLDNSPGQRPGNHSIDPLSAESAAYLPAAGPPMCRPFRAEDHLCTKPRAMPGASVCRPGWGWRVAVDADENRRTTGSPSVRHCRLTIGRLPGQPSRQCLYVFPCQINGVLAKSPRALHVEIRSRSHRPVRPV